MQNPILSEFVLNASGKIRFYVRRKKSFILGGHYEKSRTFSDRVGQLPDGNCLQLES